jgi:hypothetical protein
MRIYTFILILLVMSCKETEQWKKVIATSNKLSVFTISRTPTAPSEQDAQKKYYQDYEIQQTLPLTAAQAKALKEALTKPNNFSKDDLKRCPFLPQYAIGIDDTMTATISQQPCARIQFQQQHNKETLVMDLVEGNSITNILGQE